MERIREVRTCQSQENYPAYKDDHDEKGQPPRDSAAPEEADPDNDQDYWPVV
jgi:hypothetical protein